MRIPHLFACSVLCALIGCGEPGGPYETAGLEVRSSGGDEVISEEGAGVGTDSGPGLAAPVATRDAFQEALNQAQLRREREIAQADPESPAHRRLLAELTAIKGKLANLDLTFLQQRNAFVLAQGSLTSFVYQYAPEREWEVTYAIRSGDIGLGASIVRDVLARAEKPESRRVDHIEIAQEETALDEEMDTHISDMAVDTLKIEVLGAEALLKLAKLAIEAADFGEAERQLRACLNYQSDLTVRAEALNDYSAVLKLLDRGEEAKRIDAIAARTLDSAQ